MDKPLMEIKTSVEALEASVLPQAHVVHTQPCKPTAEAEPLPAALAAQPVAEKSAAQWAYERLGLYIKNFEERLDADQEMAIALTGGSAGVLRIEGIGYFAPDILTFYGRDESGARTQLIQHVSQLNFMLTALPKEKPTEEPRRIGFRLVADMEKSS